ncbi:MAG TPA: glycosyltransferase family 4 protein [Dehalococcoidia bacterium]|nr:glycosyltransferase family 4 protein [Dehalococcoidia bacterium]
MRILQIAPLWETVPPPAYGGTEAVVHLLVEELVSQGHDVTLCASGDSRTSATLRASYPRSLRTAKEVVAKDLLSWHHAALSMAAARDYDIVHNHAGEQIMALRHLVPDVPMLTTMHCLITPDTKLVWDQYTGHYNAISWAQRRTMPDVSGDFASVVYNAIDVRSFPFRQDDDGYLLFLSRISPEKGPHIAVEVALRTGYPLVMAGKVDPVDAAFFRDTVEPLIDGSRIRFVGEADSRTKRALYRDAHALLMPITWDEPFGLVLAEAQACGTPVITFDRGAAAEIVSHQRTGFVVSDVDAMSEAVPLVKEIDPARCREHVESHFDGPIMARNYLRVYQSIIEDRPLARTVPAPQLPDARRSTQVA